MIDLATPVNRPFRTRLTVEEARHLPYVDLLSLLQETNRCPGGTRTILNLLRNARVDRESRVLEIGSNTGFTSFEIARSARCKVDGIDVNSAAVATANTALSREISSVRSLVQFQVASVYELPYADESFDLVVAGGALSFVDDKDMALEEIRRVLKPWGYFSATNLCCTRTPDLAAIAKVSDIIGVELRPHSGADWMKVYDATPGFQRVFEQITHLGAQPHELVEAYVAHFAQKPHLRDLDAEVVDVLISRWREVMHCFNANHRHLGYVELMYRKTSGIVEPELFVPDRQAVMREGGVDHLGG